MWLNPNKSNPTFKKTFKPFLKKGMKTSLTNLHSGLMGKREEKSTQSENWKSYQSEAFFCYFFYSLGKGISFNNRKEASKGFNRKG